MCYQATVPVGMVTLLCKHHVNSVITSNIYAVTNIRLNIAFYSQMPSFIKVMQCYIKLHCSTRYVASPLMIMSKTVYFGEKVLTYKHTHKHKVTNFHIWSRLCSLGVEQSHFVLHTNVLLYMGHCYHTTPFGAHGDCRVDTAPFVLSCLQLWAEKDAVLISGV